MTILAFIAALGAGLMAFESVNNRAAALIGLWLVYVDTATVILAYQLTAANVAGHTKRPIAMAFSEVAFGLGTIIGPQTFRAQDAPSYFPARLELFVMLIAGGVFSALLWVYYRAVNARRDRRAGEYEIRDSTSAGWTDITDREDKTFRYTL